MSAMALLNDLDVAYIALVAYSIYIFPEEKSLQCFSGNVSFYISTAVHIIDCLNKIIISN